MDRVIQQQVPNLSSVCPGWMDEEFEVLQHPDRVSVRNTRSQSRSGIEERIEVIDLSSSGNTGSTYRMSIPSQQRPPPPPPPPPAPAAAASAGTDPGRGNQNLNFSTPQNIATQTNENEPIFHPQDEVEEEEERIELKIRSMNRGEIVKILVTPNLRQEDFANCVAHAALSPVDGMKLFQTWCADEDVVDLSRIAVSIHFFRVGIGSSVNILQIFAFLTHSHDRKLDE